MGGVPALDFLLESNMSKEMEIVIVTITHVLIKNG